MCSTFDYKNVLLTRPGTSLKVPQILLQNFKPTKGDRIAFNLNLVSELLAALRRGGRGPPAPDCVRLHLAVNEAVQVEHIRLISPGLKAHLVVNQLKVSRFQSCSFNCQPAPLHRGRPWWGRQCKARPPRPPSLKSATTTPVFSKKVKSTPLKVEKRERRNAFFL